MPLKRALVTARLDYEHAQAARGFRAIVGLDEAGRGAWAGPVAAAAVRLPQPYDDTLTARLRGARDSKQMTPRQRETIIAAIQSTAVSWGIGSASAAEIDQIGILPATKLAMTRALAAMQPQTQPDCLLLDTMTWPECPIDAAQVHIKEGDQHALSIAAASILAKTWRDDIMRSLDADYPDYSFGQHKGYGTPQHHAALDRHGPCWVHRRSFAPIHRRIASMGDDQP